MILYWLNTLKMVEVSKGTLNPHPMHKNRVSRQFFFITASSARGRAQPNMPPCPKFCRKCLLQVTRDGTVFTEHAPMPSLLFKMTLAN
ncbi:hypothetical protein Hanom_Chr01g00042111 [Helianthus anomalus]